MPDTNNTLTVTNVKSYSSSSLSSTTSSSIPNANNETDNPTTPAKSSDVEGTETRPDVTSPSINLTSLSTADAIESNDTFASINKSNHNDNANKPASILTDDYKSNGIVHLPWNMHREKEKSMTSILPNLSGNKKPGEYIMNLVFHNFVMISNRKIEQIVNGDRKTKSLKECFSKSNDLQFDRIVSTLGNFAENCLPSILKALFYCDFENLDERKELAVYSIVCIVLIDILKQLQYHPGNDELINHTIDLAFKRFLSKDLNTQRQQLLDSQYVTDLFAEVIGVLTQTRFSPIKKRFTSELTKLKTNATTLNNSELIVKLFIGMKYFRIKMVPIEDFEASFQFMNECAQYFLDCKDKDVKHALAGLFVDILLPVSAIVKHEVNVPCLKLFVDLLFQHSIELSTKTKHRVALFPLVTCLLCVSQKQFFLNNWQVFITLCLQNLKSRDQQHAQVALESIYRLIWVYVIRIKCEKINDTNHRLQGIINSLFPKGTKLVIPKDASMHIFVNIVCFIAYEKIDFAMKEIIYDLLAIGKSTKDLIPLRMDIGLKAFLLIADNLQNKDGPPPMPQVTTSPSTAENLQQHVKLTKKSTTGTGTMTTIAQSRILTDSLIKDMGLSVYYEQIRRAFQDILKLLDNSIGRTFLLTRPDNINSKELISSADNKTKLCLLRTCVSAIPRLLPNIKESEVVEVLARLTIHVDDELRQLAMHALNALIAELPSWRKYVFMGFCNFILKEITDLYPTLLENSFKALLRLLNIWKSSLLNTVDRCVDTSDDSHTLCHLEGFAILILCQPIASRRLYGLTLLRDVKTIGQIIKCFKATTHNYMIDVIDSACPQAMDAINSYLKTKDKYGAASKNERIEVNLEYLIEQSILWDQMASTTELLNELNSNSTTTLTTTSANSANIHQTQLISQQLTPTFTTAAAAAPTTPTLLQSTSATQSTNTTTITTASQSVAGTQASNILATTQATTTMTNENLSSGISVRAAINTFNFLSNLNSTNASGTRASQSIAKTESQLSTDHSQQPQHTPMVDEKNQQHFFTQSMDFDGSLVDQQQASTSLLGLSNTMASKTQQQPPTTTTTDYDNFIFLHSWSECLGIFLSHNHVFTKCPQSRIEAWPYIHTRLIQLFPYVDPNDTNDTRTSLFGGQPSLDKLRKQANERLNYLNIWKNYLICAFSLTPGSGKTHLISNESLLQHESILSSQSTLENSKFYTTCATATSLLKIIVPFLKCDCNLFREIIVHGVGHINIDALRDLFEELIPYIKESIDRKQERGRRKKRDYIRLALIKIFEHICDTDTFVRYCYEFNDEGIKKTFFEYIDGCIYYLDQEQEKHSDVVLMIRSYFSKFIERLVHSIIKYNQKVKQVLYAQQSLNLTVTTTTTTTTTTTKKSLIHTSLRTNLFYLIDKWSGRYSITNKNQIQIQTNGILELSSLKACASLLCLDSLDLMLAKNADDTFIYTWLNQLLEQNRYLNNNFVLNTLIRLLQLNAHNPNLLDWILNKFYSSTHDISDLCFLAICKVYIDNDVEFYIGSILTIALLNIGCTRLNIHESAIKLLRIINQRHLQQQTSSTVAQCDLDIVNSLLAHSKSQLYLSEYIARKNPEQSMQILSEITSKLEMATYAHRKLMFLILIPWTYNLELVDANVSFDEVKLTDESFNGLAFLQDDGYGCVSATEMILINLFYLTCKLNNEHASDLELIWTILASTWQRNLKIILRFLFVVITLSPYEMCKHVKKVIKYLFRINANRVISELMADIDISESYYSLVEKTDAPPYYRYKILSNNNNINSSNNITTNATNVDDFDSTTPNTSNNNTTKESDDMSPNNEETAANTIPSNKMPRVKASILPMPLFGGYFCPLNTLMFPQYQHTTEPKPDTLVLLRSHISLVLLSEIMYDGIDFNWSNHIHIIIHYCILNFDNPMRFISEHVKKLFVNLLYVLCLQNELYSHADYILENVDSIVDAQSIIFDQCSTFINNQAFVAKGYDAEPMQNSGRSSSPDIHTESADMLFKSSKANLESIVEHMKTRLNLPLWPYEILTTDNYQTSTSCKCLTEFIDNLKQFLLSSIPNIYFDLNWSKYSLNTGLYSSCRHYAGRSLQIYRALNIEFHSFKCLLNILARLMETVAEHNTEIQGYVIELLLTIKKNIKLIASEYYSLKTKIEPTSTEQQQQQQQQHTGSLPVITYPNRELIKAKSAALSRSFPYHGANHAHIKHPMANKRQHLYDQCLTLALFDRKWLLMQQRMASPSKAAISKQQALSPNKHHHHQQQQQQQQQKQQQLQQTSLINVSEQSPTKHKAKVSLIQQYRNFYNSTAATTSASSSASSASSSLHLLCSSASSNLNNRTKTAFDYEADEYARMLVQIFYTGMCLLESDYEFEFHMGCELLDDMLTTIVDLHEFDDILLKYASKIKWAHFAGLQNLLAKGCTSTVTFVITYRLLCKLIDYTCHPCVDPDGKAYHGLSGLATNMIIFMPYMLANFDRPNETCLRAAESYTKAIQRQIDLDKAVHLNRTQVDNLNNLMHIFNLYLTGKFQKDRLHWSKCVITYLCEVFIQQQHHHHHDDHQHNYHLNWIVYLMSLLDNLKLTSTSDDQTTTTTCFDYQQCIMICLNSLLNSYNLKCVTSSTQAIFNNDFLRVLIRYLDNDQLWQDALDLCKIVVNKSSTLEQQQTNVEQQQQHQHAGLSSTLATSPTIEQIQQQLFGNNKKQLPGRTLDFNFDFASTMTQQQAPTSQYKHRFNTNATGGGMSRLHAMNLATTSLWKRPQQSQSRTRERLLALINLSDKHIGLPKSPSVIFSQSDLAATTTATNPFFTSIDIDEDDEDKTETKKKIEDNDDKSMNRVCSLSDIRLIPNDDDGSKATKPTTLTDNDRQLSLFNLDDNNFINNTFSFLDDVDTAIGSGGNAWRSKTKLLYSNEQLQPRSSESDVATTTVIKHSSNIHRLKATNQVQTSGDDEDDEDDGDDDLADDDEDDTFFRSINSSSKKSSKTTLAQQMTTSIGAPGAGDLECSTGHNNNTQQQQPNKMHNMSVCSDTKDTNTRSSLDFNEMTSSLGQQHHQQGDDCMTTSTIVNSLSLMPVFSNIMSISNNDEIDEYFRMHVLSVATSNDNFNIVESFYLFKKLFKETRRRLNIVISECCHYLTRSCPKLFHDIESSILVLLDVINTKTDCPLVFLDTDIVQSSNAIDKHRKILWEIGENFDTYASIKQTIIETLQEKNCFSKCLDVLKNHERNRIDEQKPLEIDQKLLDIKMEMCKKLCKLLSQFIIMLQSYSKMIANLSCSLANITITDQSSEMTRLKRMLVETENDRTNGRLSPLNIDVLVQSKSQQQHCNYKDLILNTIIDCVKQSNYLSAIEYQKITQQTWPNEFGRLNENDFDTILLVVCLQKRNEYPNFVAIIDPQYDFNEICQLLLMEIIKTKQLIHTMETKMKTQKDRQIIQF